LRLAAHERPSAAIAEYRQAIALKPDYVSAHNNLGSALRAQGQITEAIASFEEALQIDPHFAEAHNNLGNALQQQDRSDAAIACYERAFHLSPAYATAYNNLGNVLRRQGKLAEAIVSLQRAIVLEPKSADAYNNLGLTLHEQGKRSEAIAAYRQAISLKPDLAEAHYNLGNALAREDNLTEAIAYYRKALALSPNYQHAQANLFHALMTQGELGKADMLRVALALKLDRADTHSSLLFWWNYRPDAEPMVVFGEHQRWGKQHGLALAAEIKAHTNDCNPIRRLRVGYVSPDFRAHSVAYFVERVIGAHDRQTVEVTCYANVRKPDEVTTRVQQLADRWRDIYRSSDEAVAEQIRADQIDILVDLAGHTADNRLLVFARKPAPVQVAYLGYPNTTGLATIGYRITDAWADPPGTTEGWYTETIVRLPQGFLCYQPAADTPVPGPLPALRTGYITFGSFNNVAKVNEHVIACWAAILRTLPDGKLLLKAKALADTGTRERFQVLFAKYGVPTERLQLCAWMPTAEHLQGYDTTDIALDPFPYNGTTTTCEALWMGVPVVTLAGKMHAGRVGVSLLTQVGLPELIAKTPERYVALAVELASDLKRLQSLRQGLRECLKRSPLMDAAGFTRSLEQAYREMWKKYCQAGGK
jgi:predicted O-linked N-acetylglucosamine transferase (SPINDLY family)